MASSKSRPRLKLHNDDNDNNSNTKLLLTADDTVISPLRRLSEEEEEEKNKMHDRYGGCIKEGMMIPATTTASKAVLAISSSCSRRTIFGGAYAVETSTGASRGRGGIIVNKKPRSILRPPTLYSGAAKASARRASEKSLPKTEQQPEPQRQQDHHQFITSLRELMHRASTDSFSSRDDSSCTGSCACRATRSCADPAAITRVVRFDPRITVTQYYFPTEEERRLQAQARIWYSRSELDAFKSKECRRASDYLSAHPEHYDLYSLPRRNPVTGKYVVKPIFDMPNMRASSYDDHDDSDEEEDEENGGEDGGEEAMTGGREKELPEISQTQRVRVCSYPASKVQRILIVEPNRVIQDLFRRTLETIFPDAIVVALGSAEEALDEFNNYHAALDDDNYDDDNYDDSSSAVAPAFDVVIAEERLTVGGDGLARSPQCTTTKTSSVRATIRSGSELFRGILDAAAATGTIPSAAATTCTAALSTVSSPPPPPGTRRRRPRRAAATLLIGVSCKPQQDFARWKECGADLVWGKPPPHQGLALRNEILLALARKRTTTTSTGTTASGKKEKSGSM